MTAQLELLPKYQHLLENHKKYGFSDKNAMINYALEKLEEQFQVTTQLATSAELYAQLYEEDEDLQLLTQTALNDLE
ncbi:MAG: hypothetical protein U0Y10_26605 [Spirosomataceae bacterium]